MNVLSYLYGIIMDLEINVPGHGKNVVYRLNATLKRYLKDKMELIGKLVSNVTSKSGMLPSASNMSILNFQNNFYKLSVI